MSWDTVQETKDQSWYKIIVVIFFLDKEQPRRDKKNREEQMFSKCCSSVRKYFSGESSHGLLGDRSTSSVYVHGCVELYWNTSWETMPQSSVMVRCQEGMRMSAYTPHAFFFFYSSQDCKYSKYLTIFSPNSQSWLMLAAPFKASFFFPHTTLMGYPQDKLGIALRAISSILTCRGVRKQTAQPICGTLQNINANTRCLNNLLHFFIITWCDFVHMLRGMGLPT